MYASYPLSSPFSSVIEGVTSYTLSTWTGADLESFNNTVNWSVWHGGVFALSIFSNDYDVNVFVASVNGRERLSMNNVCVKIEVMTKNSSEYLFLVLYLPKKEISWFVIWPLSYYISLEADTISLDWVHCCLKIIGSRNYEADSKWPICFYSPSNLDFFEIDRETHYVYNVSNLVEHLRSDSLSWYKCNGVASAIACCAVWIDNNLTSKILEHDDINCLKFESYQ